MPKRKQPGDSIAFRGKNAAALALRVFGGEMVKSATPDTRLDRIREIILTVENRAMACDGPVTNTRIEMTDEELREIFVLAGGKIHGE